MLRLATVSTFALAAALPVAAQEVNLYSGRHYDVDLQLYQAFTDQTGIEVNLIEGSGDQLQARIEAEGANSPADVFWTVDGGRLHRAVEAGILQPAESDVLEARIPATERHPDNLWFGLTKRARVIYYNAEAGVPDGVSTYEDLGNPDLDASICIRTSSNIYNISLMAELIEVLGEDAAEDWARGLVGNLARDPQGGDTDQIRAVAAGACDLAVGNTYYWGRLQTSDDPANNAVAEATRPLFPNQDGRGTHVNVSGAGVVAGAPNPDNAVAFLEFLASDQAQQILADANNEFPVVEGVEITGPMADYADFNQSDVNAAVYGENAQTAVEVWDRAGMP